MVRRIFVEKKADPSVKALADELKMMLGVNCLSLRKILRYDVEGIDEALMSRAAGTVFGEPPLDNYYYSLDLAQDERALVVEYLDGQFDQRANSAAQCVQLLSNGVLPKVRCATVYVFGGIDGEQLARIKNYIINPVDTKAGSFDLPATLERQVPGMGKIREEIEKFISLDAKGLSEFYNAGAFAFTLEDLAFIQDYFKKENRNPTVTELKVLDVYWSDHCRHSTFLTHIKDIKISSNNPRIRQTLDKYNELFGRLYKGRSDKYCCLMDIATIAGKELKRRGLLDNLDESEEVNACSVVVDVDTDGGKEPWLIMFKNETHNHPTEIEPFGGASTCLGGAIRDPLSGRSYVYQAMRVIGGGNPLEKFEDTLKGKLPQRVLAKTAAAGYSSYGNQIGVPAGIVAEVYHDRYKAKRMEAGYVISGAPKENVVRKRPKAGDIVLLVGAPTGRDGCGGATSSSKAHNEQSVETCGAEVQKGNPPEERKILRLFRNAEAAKLIIKCNDFGAGGASVAIGELAAGVDIYLDRITKKYEGLTVTELAVSESQERMAVMVESGNAARFIELADQENLSAIPVANVTDSGRMRMFFNGSAVVDLARDFLDSSGVRQTVTAEIDDGYGGWFNRADEKTVGLLNSGQYREAVENELKKLNVCSQKGVSEMFDSTVGGATVLMPFGGKTQLTPAVVMAAKPPVNGFTETVTCSSYALYPELMIHSPYVGTANAVTAAVSKLVSCGADPATIRLSLQEYFKKLGKDPARWGEPLSAVLAAFEAQTGLRIAAIGGKDSMSGTFEKLDVPPTVVAFGMGITSDKTIIHNVFPPRGYVTHIEIPRDVNGVPEFEKTRELFDKVYGLIKIKRILAAAVVEDGGRLTALVKSLMGDKNGAELYGISEKDFIPFYGDMIVVSEEKLENLKPFAALNGSGKLSVNGREIRIEELIGTFTSVLEPVYPSSAPASGPVSDLKAGKAGVFKCAKRAAKPRVLIPVFPGTNCEYDTARAFIEAGAETDVFVVRNRTAAEIEASISELGRRLNNAQILAFPGGFSGGDEPDGSGKFIAVTFQNPRLREAVENLLFKRDGLILGVCNGFQALIKTGLLPYGKIKGQDKNSPTLTFNNIGRHVSTICKVRIASKNSPWLSCVDQDEIYSVPVSHGEGKFVCDETHLKTLIAGNQIATQYVDENGKATMEFPFNPNGSVYAVEGILSPDGRIFGKMGHTERWQPGLYQNVKGNFDMPVFKSGVNYFK